VGDAKASRTVESVEVGVAFETGGFDDTTSLT
jgi:hypothetical protein